MRRDDITESMDLTDFIINLEQALNCQDFIEHCKDTNLIKASLCTWIEVLAKRLKVEPIGLAKELADVICDMNK